MEKTKAAIKKSLTEKTLLPQIELTETAKKLTDAMATVGECTPVIVQKKTNEIAQERTPIVKRGVRILVAHPDPTFSDSWVPATACGRPTATGSIVATVDGYAASNGFRAGSWKVIS
jgi:hypothetical protein